MRTAVVSACAAALLIGAGAAHATTWNAANDFSIASNPAGPWDWFSSPAGPPTVSGTLYSTPLALTAQTRGWWNGGADRVYKNLGPGTDVVGGGIAVAQGQLILEGSNLYATAQWIAPVSGTFNINVTFIGAGAAAGTFADVLVGQYSMVYSSGTINGYGNATQSGIGTDFGTGTFSWTGNVNLFGGQAVVFMARAGGFRGINPSSAVVLDATITTVPAPAAGSALALAGLLAARRRRR